MVYDDFEDARAAAEDTGMSVGGTFLENGTPQYFLHSPEATEDEIHDLAFEIRHGRRITKYERWGIETAKKIRAIKGEELVA